MSSMSLHCHSTAIGVYIKRRVSAFGFSKQFPSLPHMLTCALLRLLTLYFFEPLFWGQYLKNFLQHDIETRPGKR